MPEPDLGRCDLCGTEDGTRMLRTVWVDGLEVPAWVCRDCDPCDGMTREEIADLDRSEAMSDMDDYVLSRADEHRWRDA